jgi:hypothetical protein
MNTDADVTDRDTLCDTFCDTIHDTIRDVYPREFEHYNAMLRDEQVSDQAVYDSYKERLVFCVLKPFALCFDQDKTVKVNL